MEIESEVSENAIGKLAWESHTKKTEHCDSVLLTMVGDSSLFFGAVDRPPNLLQPDLRSSKSFQIIICSLEL